VADRGPRIATDKALGSRTRQESARSQPRPDTQASLGPDRRPSAPGGRTRKAIGHIGQEGFWPRPIVGWLCIGAGNSPLRQPLAAGHLSHFLHLPKRCRVASDHRRTRVELSSRHGALAQKPPHDGIRPWAASNSPRSPPRGTTQGSTVETTVFGYSSPSSVPTYLKDSAGKIIWRTFMAGNVLAYADTTGSTPKVSFYTLR
jgi:hypothetical protein